MDLRQIYFVEWHDDNIRLVRSITWPLTYSSRLSSMSITLVLFSLLVIELLSQEPSQTRIQIQSKLNNEAMISEMYSALTQDSEERRATGA